MTQTVAPQTNSQTLYIEQIYLECLSQASYLVADLESGVAAVIDPRRDTDIYLEFAEKQNLRIEHILLTHNHADFVAGHLELKDKTGATIYMGRESDANFDFEPLNDKSIITLGQRIRLQILETPGHTPESICIVAVDGDEAKSVFTGDTLFVGDVGRPDLLASNGYASEDLASLLYDSLQKLAQLPDHTTVYPGHGAGSSCGKQLGSERHSTIGRQKQFNYALRITEQEKFILSVCSEQAAPPPYFAYNAKLNKEDRALLSDCLDSALKPFTLDELTSAKDAGAQLLDVRGGDDYSTGHFDGSINISMNGRFASWAGQFLKADAPLIVLCDAGREREAALRLARIGLHADGFYNYPRELAQLSNRVRKCNRVSAEELSEALDSDSPPFVLDVRNADEYAKQQIPGSKLHPLSKLTTEPLTLPENQPIVVHCQSGYRSAIAMSLLLNLGYKNLSELIGGIAEFI